MGLMDLKRKAKAVRPDAVVHAFRDPAEIFAGTAGGEKTVSGWKSTG